MRTQSALKITILFTLVFTLAVILMGAYTRLADAGLGCPDWPGCYGQLKVPTQAEEIRLAQSAFPHSTIEQDKAWLEMIHRYIAGSLGLMVLAIWLISLKTPQTPKKLPSLIAGLIIFQAALGMWTVTMKLMPIVVMSHLLGGLSLFALLLLLYLRNLPFQLVEPNPAVAKLAPFATLCLVVLVLQIGLGGWTSSNYAALSCTALPLCEGDWFNRLSFASAFSPFQGDHPSFEFGVLDYASRMTIHVSHRVWAVVTVLLLGFLAINLLRRAQSKPMRIGAWLLIFMLVVQFSLGISNVVLNLPLAVAVAHNGGAALLLLTTVYINYLLWRRVPRGTELAHNKLGKPL